MGWKQGSKAYICQDDPEGREKGYTTRVGLQVKVLSTKCGGFRPIKVLAENGDILYVHPSWLRPLNRMPDDRDTKEVRKKAALLAEERMEEIVEKTRENALPKFDTVMAEFYSLALLGQMKPISDEIDTAKDTCIRLAEETLYHKIKNGCTRDETYVRKD